MYLGRSFCCAATIVGGNCCGRTIALLASFGTLVASKSS